MQLDVRHCDFITLSAIHACTKCLTSNPRCICNSSQCNDPLQHRSVSRHISPGRTYRRFSPTRRKNCAQSRRGRAAAWSMM